MKIEDIIYNAYTKELRNYNKEISKLIQNINHSKKCFLKLLTGKQRDIFDNIVVEIENFYSVEEYNLVKFIINFYKKMLGEN